MSASCVLQVMARTAAQQLVLTTVQQLCDNPQLVESHSALLRLLCKKAAAAKIPDSKDDDISKTEAENASRLQLLGKEAS